MNTPLPHLRASLEFWSTSSDSGVEDGEPEDGPSPSESSVQYFKNGTIGQVNGIQWACQ